MPNFIRNTLGGTAVGGGSLAPRSSRGNKSDSVDSYWKGIGISKTALAILAASTKAYQSYTVVISNYSATATYTLGTSAGSIARSGNTITVSGLTNGQTANITVLAKEPDSDISDSVGTSGLSYVYTCPTNNAYVTLSGTNCNYPASPTNFGGTTSYNCYAGGSFNGSYCVAGLGGCCDPGPCNTQYGWFFCYGGNCCSTNFSTSTNWNACQAPTSGSAPNCNYPANYAATAS